MEKFWCFLFLADAFLFDWNKEPYRSETQRHGNLHIFVSWNESETLSIQLIFLLNKIYI